MFTFNESPSVPRQRPRADATLDGLVVVPTHLRYISGPLLGPALLRGAATAKGLRVETLDLAVRRWSEFAKAHRIRLTPKGALRGDHDRAFDATHPWCTAEEEQLERFLGPAPSLVSIHSRPAVALPFPFAAIHRAADALLASSDGDWIRRELLRYPRPLVVGVSVLYAGQVVWAHAVTKAVRAIWPGTRVVWGGPHVTALAFLIGLDERYGLAADGFVVGHAEGTWVQVLQSVGSGTKLPPGVGAAGKGVWPRAVALSDVCPEFGDLSHYGPRLTLPVQTTIGCAYGLCGFCTYAVIEDEVHDLDLGVLDPVLALAQEHSAVIAIKDSLVLPQRLGAIAERVDGRAEWSACTKLNARLNAELLRRLRDSGCRTLEIGVETLVPESQELIDKRQSPDLLLRVLDAAADVGLALVLNYITGFPGEDPEAAQAAMASLAGELAARRPALHSKLEHHVFEMDRLAPLANQTRPRDLRITGAWPWSSVLDWSMAPAGHDAAVQGRVAVRS